MLITPENIELNKIVKKRTLNFGTAQKMYGNLVILATDNYDDYNKVINAKLFRPQQLYSVYTPRKIKPLNRTFINIIQKDVYEDLRERTNGFLKIGKAMTSSYAGRNVLYNMVPEYSETLKLVETIKSGWPAIHIYMQTFFPNLVDNIISTFNYEKNYLIFPLTEYIDNLRSLVNINTSENASPLITFLKSLRHGTYKKEKFADISRIIFYNPTADAMVVMDPQDDSIVEKFLDYFNKIIRLNAFNNNSDSLSDIDETDASTTENEEDILENTKSKITDIVLRKVAKTLKANLEDYDSATPEEQAIISSIRGKIDTYLDNPENKNKSFDELMNTINTDKDITTNAVRFVETKRIAQKQLNQLAKNLDKETEIIDSLEDLSSETGSLIEPEKIDVDLPDIINKEVQESTITSFDNTYNKVQAEQDLMNNLTSFSEQEYLPLTLSSFSKEDTSDDFTLKDTINVKYKTNENKTLSFSLDIPKVFNGHYLKIKGNNYIIEKQLIRLPIVKTKENTVEITTNFNKITITRTNGKISRRNAYLKKILVQYKENPAYNIEYGYNVELNSNYNNDFEYDELSGFLNKLSCLKAEINTNRKDVESEFSTLNYPESFKITDNMTPVGFEFAGDKKYLLYIDNKTSILYEAINTDGKVQNVKKSENLYTYIVKDLLHDDPDKAMSIGKSYIYSKMKFIAVEYPILVFCGILTGFESILKKANIEYKLSETKLPHSSDWVEIRFKDKYFYYKDTLANSLLLNILYALNTEDHLFEDFNTPQPFIDYCVDMLGLPIYIRQTIRINFSKLIDPITRDILTYLKLPTDGISLLLLANKMLTNNAYIRKNDLCNYRIRGNELINAIMYELIAKAIMNYQNSKLNGSNKESLKLPRNALIAAIISQQNINVSSELNPVLEIEAGSTCSMKGFKGINLRQAYTPELRKYDTSMNGILSANSTPYSGAVGIKRSLTVNPKITNVRGIMPSVDINNLTAANRLSASELLSFGTATHSDPPRIAMEVSQSKHGVPVYHATKQLIGSGYDHTLAYLISDNFCFKAKQDGIIDSIDEKNKIVILKYDDGSYDAVDLQERLAKNSNSGFYINQTYKLVYKVGEKFKKGYVLAYNPSFFQGRGNDCTFTQGTLAKVAITPGDFVFEDSTYISDRLSEMCASDITMAKSVALGPNTIIHKIVNVGDHVEINDDLLNFTTSFSDSTTTEFLQDLINTVGNEIGEELGNETIKSKYNGRVSDIDIFYNVPFETLSPSLQDLITKYNKHIEARRNELIKYGIHPASIRLKPIGQQKETKINATEFNGVLITFYVTHKDKMTIGDKLTYSVALKGIITKVSDDEHAPFSEFRPNDIIDGINSANGVCDRLTIDVFYQLYANKLLIELGRWIHDEWKK